MKSTFVFIILFSVILVNHARKDPGEYWKKVMKDQPMPESIRELIHQQESDSEGKTHLVRDFDIKPNVILYHGHSGNGCSDHDSGHKHMKQGLKVPDDQHQ